jgi:recombinational DNA repair protein (RecF pathway)
VCSKCLRRCAVCGAPLCPPCSTVDPETGLVICHVCADEISYQRRARVIGRTLGGLFLGTNDKGKEQK